MIESEGEIMKIKELIQNLGLAAIIAGCFIFIPWSTLHFAGQADTELACGFKYLPTQLEIQQLINQFGYGIDEDGNIGSQSNHAWDLALFDQEQIQESEVQNGNIVNESGDTVDADIFSDP